LTLDFATKVCTACYQQICHWIKFEEKAAKSQNKTSSAETTKTVETNEHLNSSDDDLVKILNLKPFSVSIARLSEKVLATLKSKKYFKVQKNVQTSSICEIKQTKLNLNKCSACDKTFSSKQNLNRHVREVHDADRTFHCNLCDKSYKSNGYLKQHNFQVHSIIRPFIIVTNVPTLLKLKVI
jgi:hypothetical protein